MKLFFGLSLLGNCVATCPENYDCPGTDEGSCIVVNGPGWCSFSCRQGSQAVYCSDQCDCPGLLPPTPPEPPAPPPDPPAPPPRSPPADAHEVAAWLNQLYTGFDVNDDSSPLGVTMSMQNEFNLFCDQPCYHGHADCRLSASLYNDKVQITRATGAIKITMSRVAGIVVNQTHVDTALTKCSYMFDGATYNRYHNACGCSSHAHHCDDPTSAFGNVCPSTGETCKPADEEVARCSCENMAIPDRSDHVQCYFKGVAFEPGAEDQTRTMLKERISRQDGEPDSHDRLEYWNEIVLDENVMLSQLNADPAPVIPAFTYIKGNHAGLSFAKKMRDYFVEHFSVPGETPLIAIDDEMVVTNGQGPFLVEPAEVVMPSVLV